MHDKNTRLFFGFFSSPFDSSPKAATVFQHDCTNSKTLAYETSQLLKKTLGTINK